MITIIGNLMTEFQFMFDGDSLSSDNSVLVLSKNNVDVAWFDYKNKIAWDNSRLWAFSSLSVGGRDEVSDDIKSCVSDNELLGKSYKELLKLTVKNGIKLPNVSENIRNYLTIDEY